MEIVQKYGAAKGCEHFARGMLGISLSNHYFSNQRVREITEVGAATCDEFIVVVVDHPERWNWPLKLHESFAESEPRVAEHSRQRQTGWRRALGQSGLLNTVRLLDWQTAVESPEYRRNLAVIEDAYTTDAAFSAAVRAQVHENLGAKIAECEAVAGPLAPEQATDIDHYMLEELAGLYHLWNGQGYVDFYHKPPTTIDCEVFAGAHPSVSEVLPYDWSNFGLVQLADA